MTYGLTRSDTDSYTLMATVGVKGLTMSLLIGWRHLFQHQQHKSSTLSVSDAIETGHQSIGDGETRLRRTPTDVIEIGVAAIGARLQTTSYDVKSTVAQIAITRFTVSNVTEYIFLPCRAIPIEPVRAALAYIKSVLFSRIVCNDLFSIANRPAAKNRDFY